MLVSILTATLNRVDDLKRLYASLKWQSRNNFEWIIVDDGSTDGTGEWIKKIKKQSPFSISYVYQINSGKHIAINEGMRHVSGEVTVLVDSDDLALPTMIDDICQQWSNRALADPQLAVVIFERVDEHNQPLRKIPQPILEGNYNEIRYRQGLIGDYAETFKTEILKSYQFPQFAGEKFLSEEALWLEIGKHYNARFVAKGLYRTVYPVNGLTNNSRKNMWLNPRGVYWTQQKKINLQMPLKLKCKSLALLMIAGWRLRQNPYQAIQRSRLKLLAYLLTIPVLSIYFKYKMRFKDDR